MFNRTFLTSPVHFRYSALHAFQFTEIPVLLFRVAPFPSVLEALFLLTTTIIHIIISSSPSRLPSSRILAPFLAVLIFDLITVLITLSSYTPPSLPSSVRSFLLQSSSNYPLLLPRTPSLRYRCLPYPLFSPVWPGLCRITVLRVRSKRGSIVVNYLFIILKALSTDRYFRSGAFTFYQFSFLYRPLLTHTLSFLRPDFGLFRHSSSSSLNSSPSFPPFLPFRSFRLLTVFVHLRSWLCLAYLILDGDSPLSHLSCSSQLSISLDLNGCSSFYFSSSQTQIFPLHVSIYRLKICPSSHTVPIASPNLPEIFIVFL